MKLPNPRMIAFPQSPAVKTIVGRSPSSTRTTTPFPPDLLQSASKRLALLGIVVSAMVVVFVVLNTVPPLLGGPQLGDPIDLVNALCFVVALASSVGVYLLAHSGRLEPERMLDVGLLYLLTMAFIGLVVRLVEPGPVRIPQWGVSEICIVILLFPVLVPNTPRKVFVTALVAASMDPLGVTLAGWAGREVPSWPVVLEAYIWNYVSVGLALVSSHVLYALGREVSRAREMGAYHLTEPLGEGGMGQVWKARHHMLARDAAIKIIQPDRWLASEDEAKSLARRFEREAQATAALDSPNTVELYDFGVTDDGTFFYVMELLKGLDLESLVRRHGPLPSERVVHILIQACHSLADAHARGLIHRDVKPANIFICRKGLDTDFVKVLDFGIVKWRTAAPDDAGRTMENVVLGTPGYMSPETILADREIDGRADLYSLGCVAYWLLTGQVVFDANSPMDTMIQHVNKEPEPPSARSELEIDRDLERIVLHCLQKERSNRPPSAKDLMHRLRNLRIARDWTSDRSREWWDRHAPIAGTETDAYAQR
jgi:serine/threonine-protein kinase